MRIGANARVQWGAVMALLAGLTTVGAIGVAGARDPVAAVGLAAAGRRFLAVASSKPSDAAPRWEDASNAGVFRKAISVDLKDVPLGEALSTVAQQAGLRFTYSAAVVPLEARVTFSASNLTVGAVLSAVLYDAGVDVLLTSNGQAALVQRGALDAIQGGPVPWRDTDSLHRQ